MVLFTKMDFPVMGMIVFDQKSNFPSESDIRCLLQIEISHANRKSVLVKISII